MPWAAGVYTRSNGVFTGSTVWQQDAAVPVNILATRHDTHDQDIATGLNNCATIDGLNKFAATVTPGSDATYAIGTTAVRWQNIYLSSSAFLFNGATNSVQLQAGTLTALRTATFPDASGNVVLDSAGQTLTGSTLLNPTLTGTVTGAVTEVKFVAGANITITGNTDITASGTVTITASSGGGGAVTSLTDATNGGLSFSASTGAITASLSPGNLSTKATPTSSDSIVIMDAAASNAGKTATPASVLTAAGGVPTTRQVIAGAGLSGGGALSANVTLNSTVTTEASIASAATTDLGSLSSNVVTITGTTPIASFGSSANTNNPIYYVRWQAATPVTYNSVSMIILGGANITTHAGAESIVKYEGSGHWRWLAHWNNSGLIQPWTAGQYTTIGTSGGTVAISTLTLTDDGRVAGYTIINGLSGGSGGGGGTCFLWTALVSMADGSKKRGYEIRVGDEVRGAFGEINIVEGIEHLVLGSRVMLVINGDHETTDEHCHVRPDRSFASRNPPMAYSEWDVPYDVIVKGGRREKLKNIGLPDGIVTMMREGQMLQHERGPREITHLDYADPDIYPPETPLFNLKVSGSGTYTVNGYAVTGWPNKDRWDYTEWKSK